MTKSVHNDVLDAAFTELQTATGLAINTAHPASRAAAISDNLLDNEPTPSFTGPADGDVSGRKLTIDAVSGETADASGTADHFSLFDASVVLYVTEISPSAVVSSGNTVNTAAWDVEIADPS